MWYPIALTPNQRRIMWISSSLGLLLVLVVVVVAVVLQARMVPPKPNGPDGVGDKLDTNTKKKPSLFGNDFFNGLGSRDFGAL